MSFEVDFEEDDENFGLGAAGNGTFDGANGSSAAGDASNGATQASGMDHDQQQQQQPGGDKGGGQATGAPPQANVSAAAAIALQDAKESNSSVYVANLQWWTTDAEIEAACSQFGQITNVKFMEDRASGKSRGCALVEFTEPEAAVRCKEELHGHPFNGRNCMCTFPNRGMPKLTGVGPPSVPPWSASNSIPGGGRGGSYPNNPTNPNSSALGNRDAGGNFARGGGRGGGGRGGGGGRYGNGLGMQQDEMMRQEEFMRQQEFLAMQGGGLPNPAMLDSFMAAQMAANLGMMPPMVMPPMPGMGGFGMPPAFAPFGPGMGNFGFGQ